MAKLCMAGGGSHRRWGGTLTPSGDLPSVVEETGTRIGQGARCRLAGAASPSHSPLPAPVWLVVRATAPGDGVSETGVWGGGAAECAGWCCPPTFSDHSEGVLRYTGGVLDNAGFQYGVTLLHTGRPEGFLDNNHFSYILPWPPKVSLGPALGKHGETLKCCCGSQCFVLFF